MVDSDTSTGTAAAAAPAAKPLVSDNPSITPAERKPEYVAKGPIFINGVRAYNEGDGVSADAVKNLGLDKLVKKL
jgi:hypothetical protein